MMSEMTEEDFERMLDQFCSDAVPTAGEEIREGVGVELVVADGSPEDDEVIMVPQSPARAKTPVPPAEPLTSPPDLPSTMRITLICFLFWIQVSKTTLKPDLSVATRTARVVRTRQTFSTIRNTAPVVS
jgi:hypothetical protein